jgi:hypothetical protein
MLLLPVFWTETCAANDPVAKGPACRPELLFLAEASADPNSKIGRRVRMGKKRIKHDFLQVDLVADDLFWQIEGSMAALAPNSDKPKPKMESRTSCD